MDAAFESQKGATDMLDLIAETSLHILGIYGGFLFVAAMFVLVLFVRLVGWCMGWDREPVDGASAETDWEMETVEITTKGVE